MEVSDQLHTPASLFPDTRRIGGWVGPKTALDVMEKIILLLLPRKFSRK
jgi:hypothetical protein